MPPDTRENDEDDDEEYDDGDDDDESRSGGYDFDSSGSENLLPNRFDEFDQFDRKDKTPYFYKVPENTYVMKNRHATLKCQVVDALDVSRYTNLRLELYPSERLELIEYIRLSTNILMTEKF